MNIRGDIINCYNFSCCVIFLCKYDDWENEIVSGEKIFVVWIKE